MINKEPSYLFKIVILKFRISFSEMATKNMNSENYWTDQPSLKIPDTFGNFFPSVNRKSIYFIWVGLESRRV